MRPFTTAGIQAAPSPAPLSAATIKANLHTCDDLRRPARTSFPHPPPER